MKTEAQKRARRNYDASLKRAGYKRLTVVLSPRDQATLEKIAKLHGSKNAAIVNLLRLRAAWCD